MLNEKLMELMYQRHFLINIEFYNINNNNIDDVEEHNKPKRNVIAVNVHRRLFAGQSVAKKMKNDESKNDIAPNNRINLNSNGSFTLNFIITMLKLANDPGRVALFIGSRRLLLN